MSRVELLDRFMERVENHVLREELTQLDPGAAVWLLSELRDLKQRLLRDQTPPNGIEISNDLTE